VVAAPTVAARTFSVLPLAALGIAVKIAVM
jgi:hypothetical protein